MKKIKLKKSSSSKKRFFLSDSSKSNFVKRSHSHASHLATKKSNKRKRHLKKDTWVAKSEYKRLISKI